MQTIKIYLQESGSAAVLKKDFNLYRGSFQNALLNVIIPKSIFVDEFLSDYPKVLNAVSVSAKGLLPNGDEWNSRPFYLNLVKNFTQDGKDFVLYERLLPRAFVMNAGQTTVSVTIESMRIDLVPVLDDHGEPTGDFKEQTTIEQIVSTQIVTLHIMDSSNPDEEVLEPYESARINAQLGRIEEDLNLIYGLRSKGGTVSQDPNPINLTTLHDRVLANAVDIADHEVRLVDVEETVSGHTQDIADINTKMRTGTRFIGTMPASQTMPTQNDLTVYAQSIKPDAPLNGDEILFTLLDTNGHPWASYHYDFGADGLWDETQIPPIANARNGGAGLISGTYGIGATYNVIVDIIDGTIRRLFIKRTNGTYQELNLVIEDHETRITDAEDEIDGIRDGTIAVGNALRLAGKTEDTLNVAHAVTADDAENANHATSADSAVRDGIQRVIHSTYAMLTEVYTREEADQIFASKIVGEDMFFGQNTLEPEIPTTPPNGVQATVTLSDANPSDLMFFERQLIMGFRVNNRNKFTTRMFLQSDTSLNVRITLELYTKAPTDANYKLLATTTKNNVILDANEIEVVEMDGLLNGLVNAETVTMLVGDTLRAEVYFENNDLDAPVNISLITNQQYGSFLSIAEPTSSIIIRQESRKAIQITTTAWGTPTDGVYTLVVPYSQHETNGGNELGAWFNEYGTGNQIALDISFDGTGNITMKSTFPYAGVLCVVGGVTGEQGFDYNNASNKPQINGVILTGNKPLSAFDIYARGEVRQLVADATRNLGVIRGYFSAALPTNTDFLKVGDLLLVTASTAAPSTTFPWTGVQVWDGTQFNAYQPEDGNVGEYNPDPFDLWINLNITDGSGNCWAWMVTGWDIQDFHVDMTQYRTADAQDAIDADKAEQADLEALADRVTELENADAPLLTVATDNSTIGGDGTTSAPLAVKDGVFELVSTSNPVIRQDDLPDDIATPDNDLEDFKNDSDDPFVRESGLPDVPTKTSELTNDSGFISTETDPVYSADKANIALKTEVQTVQDNLDAHNTDEDNDQHPAIRGLISALEFIKDADYDDTTGDVTLTRRDNSVLTFNVFLENLLQDLDFDTDTNELVLTKQDGTEVRIDASSLVDVYHGSDGEEIQITIGTGNVINAVLKLGTVTREHLDDDVNESLDKADSAYQLDPNGIPKSDLAQEVKDSLGKADTALQDETLQVVQMRFGERPYQPTVATNLHRDWSSVRDITLTLNRPAKANEYLQRYKLMRLGVEKHIEKMTTRQELFRTGRNPRPLYKGWRATNIPSMVFVGNTSGAALVQSSPKYTDPYGNKVFGRGVVQLAVGATKVLFTAQYVHNELATHTFGGTKSPGKGRVEAPDFSTRTQVIGVSAQGGISTDFPITEDGFYVLQTEYEARISVNGGANIFLTPNEHIGTNTVGAIIGRLKKGDTVRANGYGLTFLWKHPIRTVGSEFVDPSYGTNQPRGNRMRIKEYFKFGTATYTPPQGAINDPEYERGVYEKGAMSAMTITSLRYERQSKQVSIVELLER